MRYGFTTGSCAAAAAKAAAYMLLAGQEKRTITIETPKGIPYTAELLDITRTEGEVSCGVRKDGGDDPDVTTGAIVYALVRCAKKDKGEGRIFIDGGCGVGRITKPGLDQPIGQAAINHVPREMITREVLKVCQLLDYKGNLEVIISVPQGEQLAAKTFNPRLGIEGGISILGTSGIVEPMSTQALLDTIRVELNQRYAQGNRLVAVSPGNYGLDYMKTAYGFDLDRSVKCSNFIGNTIDMAAEIGFERMLLTGHIGKMVKVAGGILNTHSKEGDCRMPLICAAAVEQQVPLEVLENILKAVTTEEALWQLDVCHKRQEVMDNLMEKIQYYLDRRSAGRMQIEVIVYSNEFGELGKSNQAKRYIKEWMAEA